MATLPNPSQRVHNWAPKSQTYELWVPSSFKPPLWAITLPTDLYPQPYHFFIKITIQNSKHHQWGSLRKALVSIVREKQGQCLRYLYCVFLYLKKERGRAGRLHSLVVKDTHCSGRVWFSGSMLGGSQMPVTPALGDLSPFFGFCKYCTPVYTFPQTHRCVYRIKNKNKYVTTIVTVELRQEPF